MSSLSFSDTGTNTRWLLPAGLKTTRWHICYCRLPSAGRWERLRHRCHHVSVSHLCCLTMHLLYSDCNNVPWCSCSLVTRRGRVLCMAVSKQWLKKIKNHVDNLKKECKKAGYQVLSLTVWMQPEHLTQIYHDLTLTMFKVHVDISACVQTNTQLHIHWLASWLLPHPSRLCAELDKPPASVGTLHTHSTSSLNCCHQADFTEPMAHNQAEQ